MHTQDTKFKQLEQLVVACQRSERKAQNYLYEHHRVSMLLICQNYVKTAAEAEDILNEAFLRIFNNIKSLNSPNALISWMKTIVRRTALNYYNRTTKVEYLHTSFEMVGIQMQSLDFEAIQDQQNKTLLQESVNGLPDGARKVFTLYFMNGLSHAQIAEALSISASTSKSQLCRAKQMMARKLTKLGMDRESVVNRQQKNIDYYKHC